MGRGLGYLAWKLDRRHRTIAHDNLRSSFQGTKSEADIQRIVVGCFQQLGESVIEFVRLPRYVRQEMARRVTVEGIEHLHRAREKGRGVLFLTGHFGNWELLAVALASFGFPIHVVARPLDNPWLDRWVNQRRSLTGNRVIEKQRSIGTILPLLKKGGAVGFLLDQNVAHGEGVFVQFFDRPACTTKGLALIALRKEVPVLPIFMIRQKEGRHRVRIDQEVSLIRTGDIEKDILRNTEQFTRVIESTIRVYPEQWLWVHQRWRTQPLR
jgi:KDO2-lipid IV(A) lauroyltransferase